MYTTKNLSACLNSPQTLSEQPGGPFSGSLVYTDGEGESQNPSFLRATKKKKVDKLPFPQDRIMAIHPLKWEKTSFIKVFFIPVLDQPLSANQYYVIKADGEKKGEAVRCTREEDVVQANNCCFGNIVSKSIELCPFDYRDIYQRVTIHRNRGGPGFLAKAVAPDGLAPYFLGERGWEVYDLVPNKFQLTPAEGLNDTLRNTSPDFSLLLANSRTNIVVVGKWYCPFLFVKEEVDSKKPIKDFEFYRMTLEQRWEEIYSCENEGGNNIVAVDTSIKREVALIAGLEAVRDDSQSSDGFVWFRVNEPSKIKGISVGVSLAVRERMNSLMEAGGWVDGGEREVGVRRVEKNASERGWSYFSCYVLVESFVFTRMDGSVTMKFDYRHPHRIECQWEV
ncbi:hypothetical protein RJ639_009666 [Escallonia herrerae]|uniref:Uncharacterized protein n=1 Tax=Escallonia herrerae TaxID=1293975 RepID=A0AA89AVL4_9ASTE|nr:hypothetical protein RJ639_009666 [Escallonia herrerae]